MNLLRTTLDLLGTNTHIVFPDGDDTILGTNEFFQKDNFKLRSIRFEPGDVVIDLGSNLGLFSLFIAKNNPDVKVYAFDAGKLACKCLQYSCLINNIDNISVFNLAIGAENQKDVSFCSDGKNHSCLVESGISSTNTTLQSTVNKIRFSELFQNPVFQIGKVKYLKMDIETAEFDILNDIFENYPAVLNRIEYLHIEFHPADCEKAIELSKKLVDKMGDRVYFDT